MWLKFYLECLYFKVAAAQPYAQSCFRKQINSVDNNSEKKSNFTFGQWRPSNFFTYSDKQQIGSRAKFQRKYYKYCGISDNLIIPQNNKKK